MPSIGKLSNSSIKQLFLGPVSGLSNYNFRQVKSLARTIGIIAVGNTINDVHAEVQAALQNGEQVTNLDEFDDNNEDEDLEEEASSLANVGTGTQESIRETQAFAPPMRVSRVATSVARNSQAEAGSVNSEAVMQENLILQFINEKKAEKLAEQLGFATVMENRKWGSMEKKDCQTIKDMALSFIKLKVLLDGTDDNILDIIDKALKLASKRLVEHMVGEVSWQAASYVGEAENPMQKAVNDALKACGWSRRDHKRKLESSTIDTITNGNSVAMGARPPKQLVTCYNCKEVGHISKNCPKKSGTLGNEGSH